MSTVQVDEEVKKKLFEIAAKLQAKLGRKISLNEALKMTLENLSNEERNKSELFSLFGMFNNEIEARDILRALRISEDRNFETPSRKPLT